MCAFGETHVVVLRGRACAFVEARSGRVEWEKDVPITGKLQPPAAGRVANQDLIVLASDTTVALIDARTGTALKRLRIPAPAIFAPVLGRRPSSWR